jgi:hypothetical protein
MSREDIMTLVERYALAMQLAHRHGNQYGDRDLVMLTHQQIREGFKALVASEREACAQLCDRFANRMMSAEECAAAIRARGQA